MTSDVGSSDATSRKRKTWEDVPLADWKRARLLGEYQHQLDELSAVKTSPFYHPRDTLPLVRALIRSLETLESRLGTFPLSGQLKNRMAFLREAEAAATSEIETKGFANDELERLLAALRKKIAEDPWMQEFFLLRDVLEKTRRQPDKAGEFVKALDDVEKERALLHYLRLHPFSLPVIFLLPPLNPRAPLPPVEPEPGTWPSTAHRQRQSAFRPTEAMRALFATFNETIFSNLLPPVAIKTFEFNELDAGVSLGMTDFIYWFEPLKGTREEHRVAVDPYMIRLFSGTLGKSWKMWKENLAHEMCHYWLLLLAYQMGERRLADDDHGPEWQAVACHAMSVYPDLDLRAEVGGRVIPCGVYDSPRYLKIRHSLKPNPAARLLSRDLVRDDLAAP